MTIQQVANLFHITQDTLRYYEKVGLIPEVTRTNSGIRDYQESDIKWVEHAVCMRNAGLSIEALTKYRELYEKGPSTYQERLDLLQEQQYILKQQQKQIQITLDRLAYKIDKYAEAIQTGNLNWEE